MATWDELDKEGESNKDEEEVNQALMASISSDKEFDVGFGSDFEEDDEVFSKLSHSDLISYI